MRFGSGVSPMNRDRCGHPRGACRQAAWRHPRSRQAVPIQWRCVTRRSLIGVALLLLLAPASPATEPLSLVHQQRYAMGTMFDIVTYHPSRRDAERAVASALDEIVRLDRVMS